MFLHQQDVISFTKVYILLKNLLKLVQLYEKYIDEIRKTTVKT